MQAKKVILPIVIIAGAVFVAIVLMAVGRKTTEKKTESDQALLVNVMPVEVGSQRFLIDSQGVVKARHEVVLVAELAAKVERVSDAMVAGGLVQAGDVLVALDDSDYQVAVKQAEATQAARRAQLAQEQARGEQAAKDWEKLNGQDRAASDLVLRKPQLAEAQAAVRAAEADLEKAQRNLERTKVRSPFTALVTEANADLGEYLSPGTPVATLASVELAEIRLPVRESDLSFVNLPEVGASADRQVPVRLRAQVGNKIIERDAVINRTEGILESSTRQVYAVARLEDPYRLSASNKEDALPLGSYVTAQIGGISADSLIALPRHVLRGADQVLVMNDANELEVRNVDVLRSDIESAYVQAGLKPGERVITTAVATPIPGTKLRVTRQGEMSAQDDSSAIAQTTETDSDNPVDSAQEDSESEADIDEPAEAEEGEEVASVTSDESL